MRINLKGIKPGHTAVDWPVTHAPFVKIRWYVSCRCIDKKGRVFKQVSGTAIAISKSGLLLFFEEDTDGTPPIVLISTIVGKKKKIGIRAKVVHTETNTRGNSIRLVKYDAPEDSRIKFITAVITSYNRAKNGVE